MTGKSLIRRERARRDLEEAADDCFADGGEAAELRFIGVIAFSVRNSAQRGH